MFVFCVTYMINQVSQSGQSTNNVIIYDGKVQVSMSILYVRRGWEGLQKETNISFMQVVKFY